MARARLSTGLLAVLTLACGDAGTLPATTSGATDTTSTSNAADGHSETSATSGIAPTSSGTGTGTGTTTTGTGTTTAPGGCPFICPPDVPPPRPFACDVFAQDCKSGEKCVPFADGGSSGWNSTRCVAVTGDQQPGDPCTAEGDLTGIDDCDFGATCWDVDKDTRVGHCVALCTGNADAPICDDPATRCVIENGGVLNLCLPSCNPLLQDCAGDDLCIAAGGVFVCVLDVSGDAGQLNDPCEFINACDPGFACIPAASSSACDPNSSGCCEPFCEYMQGMSGDCPNPDQACIQWFDPMMGPAPPGLENVGICAIPP